ncbi:AbrB/MazE/SpoVT family DNA-binding domain-containing protein [Amycolatopsis pithecellobii]|uniref:SpoVT-AbrB domain-containing protein n=1 Tax=Amycolatopsis pithecellobii TaxID=664692 RepID=A0A6N7ZBG0_9PSEU|nr:AbrB/MazE/SpoVT family DNA-binding domain-containing protein [Amycolatopsis pithecellobii]MTD59096.1 hypothetical protein [Amycolatopsis pithecellobii]
MSTARNQPPLRGPQEQLIGALVPDFAERHAEPVRMPDLPPPRPAEPSGMDTVVGMARVDRTGRVREWSVFDALGWRPGRRLRLEILDEVIVFVADPIGHHRVDERGAVTLPAAARQMCGIERGPALLLIGKPGERTLFVHSAKILTRLLADFYDDILGGSR